MAGDVTRDEFQQLATRTDIVEREVEGEKMVTRHILEQTRHNSGDLAEVKTRLDRVERKVDGLDRKIGGLDSKVDGVEDRLSHRIGSFDRSLPKIVGEVVRDVFREEPRTQAVRFSGRRNCASARRPTARY